MSDLPAAARFLTGVASITPSPIGVGTFPPHSLVVSSSDVPRPTPSSVILTSPATKAADVGSARWPEEGDCWHACVHAVLVTVTERTRSLTCVSNPHVENPTW